MSDDWVEQATNAGLGTLVGKTIKAISAVVRYADTQEIRIEFEDGTLVVMEPGPAYLDPSVEVEIDGRDVTDGHPRA